MDESKKLTVEICIGTSCHLLGTEDLLNTMKRLPPEKLAHIDLEAVTCLKNCGNGPNVRINGVVMSDMTPEKLLTAIDDHLNI